jgi:small conductance mechanosensitive channel
MQEMIDRLREALAALGPNVIAAVLILVIGWWAAKLATRLVRGAMTRAKTDSTLVAFLGNLVYMLALTMVIIAALGRLGVNTSSFVAVIAAAGLAIGFALQGSLANFAAGVMLIFFRPFKVGDYVEAGGVSGTVEEVQIFMTALKTPDNKAVVVPNSAITGGNIVNYSAKPIRRVDLVMGIGYGDDIKRAKQVLEEVVTGDDRVLDDPAPTIAVLELADSSVNFAVRPWVRTPDYWSVYFDLTERIKLEFDARGISIQFPQRDVHLHDVAAAASARKSAPKRGTARR